MKTLIAAITTTLALSTSAFAMSTADLTPHDIADGANGALTMGQVSMIDTADVVPNMANGVNLSAKLTVTSFETASIVQKGGNYR